MPEGEAPEPAPPAPDDVDPTDPPDATVPAEGPPFVGDDAPAGDADAEPSAAAGVDATGGVSADDASDDGYLALSPAAARREIEGFDDDFRSEDASSDDELVADESSEDETVDPAAEAEAAVSRFAAERERLRAVNAALVAKVVTMLSKKSNAAAAARTGDGEGTDPSAERKYRNAVRRWRGTTDEKARVEAEYAARADEARAHLEVRERRASEIVDAFRAFKSSVGATAVSSRTRRPLAPATVDRLLAEEDVRDADRSAARLRHTQLAHRRAALERRVKAKEQLSEGLHLIDFEQLKIENQALREKAEARDADVAKIRSKTSGTVQVLTHAKEKLQFVIKENEALTREIETLEVESRRKGDVMQRIKNELAAYKKENAKMEAEAATVTDPALLDDYAAQKRNARAYRRRVEEIQENLAEKTAELALTQSTGKRRAPRETPAMGLPGTEADPATLVAAP